MRAASLMSSWSSVATFQGRPISQSTYVRMTPTSGDADGMRIVLAQLALDGLELLAQDVLALGLVHLRLDFGLDPTLQLEDLDLLRQEARHELQALGHVDGLEQLLPLLRAHVRAVGD